MGHLYHMLNDPRLRWCNLPNIFSTGEWSQSRRKWNPCGKSVINSCCACNSWNKTARRAQILALVFLGAFLLLSFLIFSAWSCCFFNAWKWRFHGLRWDLPGIRSWARWISEAGGGLERTATDADGWWVDGSMTNGRWGCWRSALPMNEFTIFQFLGDRLGHSSIGSSFNPPKMGNRSYVYIIVLWDRQM